jgi:hypothetical protein
VIRKIVFGGQSGVDRAALDVARTLGIAAGGWCPRGRIAEDGRIKRRYPLVETRSAKYPQRTEWNLRDSDATLINAAEQCSRMSFGAFPSSKWHRTASRVRW